MGVKNPYHESVQWEWELGREGPQRIAQQRRKTIAMMILCIAPLVLMWSFFSALSDLMGSPTEFSPGSQTRGDLGAFMIIGWGTLTLLFLVFIPLMERYGSLKELSKCFDNSCQQAVTLAKSSSAANAWRNEAIEHGRELRLFDLAAMRKLKDLEKHMLLIPQRTAACRAAHGFND